MNEEWNELNAIGKPFCLTDKLILSYFERAKLVGLTALLMVKKEWKF